MKRTDYERRFKKKDLFIYQAFDAALNGTKSQYGSRTPE